jgi:hypothetical protein
MGRRQYLIMFKIENKAEGSGWNLLIKKKRNSIIRQNNFLKVPFRGIMKIVPQSNYITRIMLERFIRGILIIEIPQS